MKPYVIGMHILLALFALFLTSASASAFTLGGWTAEVHNSTGGPVNGWVIFDNGFPTNVPAPLSPSQLAALYGVQYDPQNGNSRLNSFDNSYLWNEVSINGTTYFYLKEGLLITVSTSVFLNAGDTVSGFAQYGIQGEWPPRVNPAWVQITGTGGSSTPWYHDVEELFQYYNFPTDTGHIASLPEDFWNWTAPVSGTYSISLNISGDDLFPAWADIRDIEVSPFSVPEPPGCLLLAIGCPLVLTIGRRFGPKRPFA